MKKLFLAILLCCCSIIAFAQTDSNTYKHLPAARITPLWVINGIIGTSNIKPGDIDSLHVVKNADNFPAFKNLDRYGIVFARLKRGVNVDSKKLSDFKNELHIKQNVQFAIDGYYVADANLFIATQSIIEINVIRPNAQNKLTDVVINVWTFDHRLQNAPIKSADGTLYIR